MFELLLILFIINMKEMVTKIKPSQLKNIFMFSKDNDEEHVMHSKSNNIEIMINDKVDEVIEELFSVTCFQISKWVSNINKI